MTTVGLLTWWTAFQNASNADSFLLCMTDHCLQMHRRQNTYPATYKARLSVLTVVPKGYSASTIHWATQETCITRKNPGLELFTGHLCRGHPSIRQAMHTAGQTNVCYKQYRNTIVHLRHFTKAAVCKPSNRMLTSRHKLCCAVR